MTQNAYKNDTHHYSKVQVMVYWWDLYKEKFGAPLSITPATDEADFVYKKDRTDRYLYANALAHYELTTLECDEQLLSYWEAWDGTAKAQEQQQAGRDAPSQPNIGQLSLSSLQLPFPPRRCSPLN